MAPVESVQQHGKLWLVEDDTRTHLSPPDSGYGRLDRLALEHLKKWRFEALALGEGNQWGVITFRFILE